MIFAVTTAAAVTTAVAVFMKSNRVPGQVVKTPGWGLDLLFLARWI